LNLNNNNNKYNLRSLINFKYEKVVVEVGNKIGRGVYLSIDSN